MPLSSSSSSTSAAEWLPTLARALSKHGFDICHPFHTSWYNQTLDNDNVGKSDDDDDKVGGATKKKGLCRRLPVGQAVLIGNTARLWPFFQTWLQQQQQQHTPLVDNPLDTFVTQTIRHVTQTEHVLVDNNNNDTVAPPPPIFWDYDWDPANLVSMSRVATVSGLCYYHPTAQLAIHPVYGPWLSFRAVVVVLVETLETSSSPLPPPPQLENPLTRAQDLVVCQAAQKAWAHNNDNGHSTTTTTDAIQPWIALRDSIPIGRPYRFSQNQLLYHYTRNVDELLQVSSSSKRRVVPKQASF